MASTKNGGTTSSHKVGPSGYGCPTGQEHDYLARLIEDFGPDGGPEAHDASQRIFDRYSQLVADYVEIGDSIRSRVEEGKSLRKLLRERAVSFHSFLYDDILGNAGRYREEMDPKRGRVYFGGQQAHKGRPRYEGALPNKIEGELDEAFEHLAENLSDDDPIRSAVLFYAHFVYVHPFYDANGRIGRMLVSIYLYLCGYYINWRKLDQKKNKFISKLNACHDRRNSLNKEKHRRYQDYLVDFFRRYVTSHQEFYNPDIGKEEL